MARSNNSQLIGHLTSEPELKQVNFNNRLTSVATGAIAVPRDYRNANGETPVDTIRYEAWGEIGTSIFNTLHVDTRVSLQGSIRVKNGYVSLHVENYPIYLGGPLTVEKSETTNSSSFKVGETIPVSGDGTRK